MEQPNAYDVLPPDSIPCSSYSNLHLKSVDSSPTSPESVRPEYEPPAELVNSNGHDRITFQSDSDHDSNKPSSSIGDSVLPSDGPVSPVLRTNNSRRIQEFDAEAALLHPQTDFSSSINSRRISVESDGVGAPQPDCSSLKPSPDTDSSSSPNDTPIPVESDGGEAPAPLDADNGHIPVESDGGAAPAHLDADNGHIPAESDSCPTNNNNRPIPVESNGDEADKEMQVVKQEIFAVDIPAIGEFIRRRSSSISSAISRRIASMKELRRSKTEVTEFDVTGVKVVVEEKARKENAEEIRGIISFFSRSNCRDCRAVRLFLRERGVPFVEINLDVYPLREKELVQRTGSCTVPQIFFEDKLVGGLVALNSLRNSGLLEVRMKEVMGTKRAGNGPAEPVYGRDDPVDDPTDVMARVASVLREKMGVQDRVVRVRVVKSCFSSAEMVEVIRDHLGCTKEKAVEVGKALERKHFVHRVFGEDGDLGCDNNLYRFLEHEPFIPKCLNFRGFTNDLEPKSASFIGRQIMKLMTAILESFASDDRRHVDYAAICRSEEFRRYINLVEGLQRVDMEVLGEEEKVAFFMNLHNAMAIHIIIRGGRLDGIMDRRSFVSDFMYLVGGHSYSLSNLKNGILRNNQRPPYSIIKPFGAHDRRLQYVISNVNPLVHFGLCNGTKSGPVVQFFSHEGVVAELRSAARDFFRNGGIEVDLDRRTVYLSRIFKWFSVDFGNEKEVVKKWIMDYLDSTKAGLVTHLCVDGSSPLNIVYQSYDWSLNM